MFPLDQPIDEESGKKIAIWAAGGAIMDDTARHLKSLESADSMDALKASFESAYKSTKDEAKRAQFKKSYDTRKDQLSTGTTA